MSESGLRVKFSLRRIDGPWQTPESWHDLAWLLSQLEQFGCLPVMEDGLLAGNVALRTDNGLIVSRSGRRPGELSARDFVEVVSFDPSRWEATFHSAAPDIKPTSDTPLHWASLIDTFVGASPFVSVHGHALETVTEAMSLGIPISPVETEFSTLEDRTALVELLRMHPFPRDAVYVRRGHGFFVLAMSVTEAAVRVKNMMDQASHLKANKTESVFLRS